MICFLSSPQIPLPSTRPSLHIFFFFFFILICFTYLFSFDALAVFLSNISCIPLLSLKSSSNWIQQCKVIPFLFLFIFLHCVILFQCNWFLIFKVSLRCASTLAGMLSSSILLSFEPKRQNLQPTKDFSLCWFFSFPFHFRFEIKIGKVFDSWWFFIFPFSSKILLCNFISWRISAVLAREGQWINFYNVTEVYFPFLCFIFSFFWFLSSEFTILWYRPSLFSFLSWFSHCVGRTYFPLRFPTFSGSFPLACPNTFDSQVFTFDYYNYYYYYLITFVERDKRTTVDQISEIFSWKDSLFFFFVLVSTQREKDWEVMREDFSLPAFLPQ